MFSPGMMEKVMADGRVSASSEGVSTEQRDFSSEKDIPDPAIYVSSLKTDELKAELNKRGLKRSENKSALIDRLRAAIQSNVHGDEPIERRSSNAGLEEREMGGTGSINKLTIEDLASFIEVKGKEVCHFEIDNLKSEASASYANELIISLQNENKELKEKLQELESNHTILKQEANSLREENKSLLTVIRLMHKELQNPNEVKCVSTTSTNLHDQISESVNDNNTYDQANETKEAAHASCQTTETTEHSANQSGTQQPKGKRSVLLIGDSMIKAIGEQRLSRSQFVKKICLGGAKITAIKDQLIPELQHNTYDSVIIHAGPNDLNEYQSGEILKGLTEVAEESIKIRPSIKVLVSGLICQREENAHEKIMHINHTMKAICASRGCFFIDNARIEAEHLKNKGIHLNGDGVRILASNFMKQALKVKIKAGKRKRKQDPLWLLVQTLKKIIRTSSES